MFEPVYGPHGIVTMWLERVTHAEDDDESYAAYHRVHLLRRFYSWHHLASKTKGRTSALFLDFESYSTTLIAWATASYDWSYSISP